MSRLLLLALLLAPPPPPKAPVREVKDTYFGTTIVDPYRWLEDEKSTEVAAWLKGQNDHARAVLAALPLREAFLARLRELDDGETRVAGIQRAGSRWFYFKTAPGDDDRKLYGREKLNAPERLLVDPEKLGDKDHHVSIDYFQASLDGRYALYGASVGGSEQSVIRVLEVKSARPLPDSIDRAQYASPSWRPDGKSFFYMRLQKLAPGAPPTEIYQKMRVYLHVLGTDPEKDSAVFGWEVSPRAPIDINDFPFVGVTPGSRFVVAGALHGVKPEQTLFVAPLDKIGAKDVPWRKLAGVDDAVTGYDVHGDDVYLQTHKDASRFQIVHTRLDEPDLAHADVVVPQSEGVVTLLGVAQDALYWSRRDGAISHLFRLPWRKGGGGKAEPLAVPTEGSVGFVTDPRLAGATVFTTSWTQSGNWSLYDPHTRKLSDTGFIPPSRADFSGIVAEEVQVPSTDGAQVPLSIVHKRNLPLDGTHPTLLDGYGSYGVSIEPYYNAMLLAWLEKGGVYAVAHVRGGGEYGEDWHQAGKMKTKQHTIDDFIASALYLMHMKFTQAAHLAGEGTSAGGILIGGAITRHPELFGAAVDRVGCSDTLRFETTQGGAANVPEFGTIKKQDEFRWLLAMSPYHHVKAGTRYPAVLLTTGVHDPRVPSWQPAKMTARLQAATTSGKPILLRVEYDAGHGLGSTRSQRRTELADEYAFLWWQLGG